MRALRLIFFLFFSILFFASCGKSAPSAPTALEVERESVLGALTPVVAELTARNDGNSCDRANLPAMKEISAVIDSHQGEIDAYVSGLLGNQDSRNFRYVQVGPIVVRETRFSPPSPSGWQTKKSSWKKISKTYEATLRNPTPKNWMLLNESVRSILSDDRARILSGYRYSIGYLDFPVIQGALAVVRSCLSDASCSIPRFSTAQMAWFSRQRDYHTSLSKLETSPDREFSAEILANLKESLQKDAQRFTITRFDSIWRNGSTLHVPLFAGPFAEVTEELAGYLAATWKGPELRVVVDWLPAPAQDFFTMLVAPGAGGRSFVNMSRKEVRLSTSVPAKSITHEFGHVLGFPDHYYVIWNDRECEYEDQFFPGDLMSDSRSGIVTEAEWETLRATYSL